MIDLPNILYDLDKLHESCCRPDHGNGLYLIVVGSRLWDDYGSIRDWIADHPPHAVVVSGGARGADALAIRAARELGYHWEVFKADWDNPLLVDGLGHKKAGPHRNMAMVDAIRARVDVWIEARVHALGLRRGVPDTPGSRDVHAYLRALELPVTIATP